MRSRLARRSAGGARRWQCQTTARAGEQCRNGALNTGRSRGGARAADHRATTVDNLTASDGVSAMAMQISVLLAMARQIEQLLIEG